MGHTHTGIFAFTLLAMEAGDAMNSDAAIAVLGTFDSKGDEHLFLKQAIEKRGLKALTINVGTKSASTFTPDIDLRPQPGQDRDRAIKLTIERARQILRELYDKGEICAVISAGGGSGTHLATSVMKVLPLGAPKVMVSTVAAHDMAPVVGTKDITMIHSVGDLLGLNSISGLILDQAAGAVCGMAQGMWSAPSRKARIALSMFGFITTAAEGIKARLEEMGYEVVAFHANGTGGLAMEELAAEGRFDAILDLATHELADTLKDGYCKLIGPGRLAPIDGKNIPRLVVPGGLDCAVLEFTRNNIPSQYQGRNIFFYDFRSAVGLDQEESIYLANELADKLNRNGSDIKVLIPLGGWSDADGPGAPLHAPALRRLFIDHFRAKLDPAIEMTESEPHINDEAFMDQAAQMMSSMVK